MNYVLKKKDGTVLEATGPQGPVTILFGHDMLPKSVEDAIEGKEPGDSVNVEAESRDAFGERSDNLVYLLPASLFDKAESLNVGDDVMVNNGAGEIIVKITALEGNQVTVDANHPYAGMDVLFEIGVMDVRETTPEDLSYFYQGHDHSCGCGGSCDSGTCGCGSSAESGGCGGGSCGCDH